MARILFLNSVCYGSTGNICKTLYKMAEAEGHECCIAYGRGNNPEGFQSKRIGSNIDVYCHAALSRIGDMSGFGSMSATKNFVNWLEEYKPDIIHMHNLHGYYINIEIFFQYLKRHPEIKKIWTLHDCWSFTGHCAHYLHANCYKWIDQCDSCAYKNTYPKTFIDRAKKNYSKKKEAFTGIDNLMIISVSEWLKEQVQKSYLKGYENEVITSGIDTKVFQYRENDFKKKYDICDRVMILGVASVWDEKKGLDDFEKLVHCLAEKYVIVLVGLSKQQVEKIDSRIIGIERTENQVQLAEIYSAADVFFNPTKEETFGLTNVEAQACGTTVVSYDAGGTIETLKNENAYVVKNIDEFKSLLSSIDYEKIVDNKAKEEFDKDLRMSQYLKYYSEREK